MIKFKHQKFLSALATPSLIPDPGFYLSELKKCNNVDQIKQVHSQVIVTGLLKNLTFANKLLHSYTTYRALAEAHTLFCGFKESDPKSWSVMIGGFARNGGFSDCLRMFREYVRSGDRPGNYALPFVIRVCRDSGDLEMGRVVHQSVYKFGLHSDPHVAASLVDMYAKCRVLDDAKKVFDRMPDRDLVSWTVMIGAFTECGTADEALEFLDRMQEEGVEPDNVAMTNIVNACAKLGTMHKARVLHDYISSKRFGLGVVLGTAMIDMFAKCGSVDGSRRVFDE